MGLLLLTVLFFVGSQAACPSCFGCTAQTVTTGTAIFFQQICPTGQNARFDIDVSATDSATFEVWTVDQAGRNSYVEGSQPSTFFAAGSTGSTGVLCFQPSGPT